MPTISRRIALSAAWTAVLYSVCGLVFGNAPRLAALFGPTPFVVLCAAAAFILAGAAIRRLLALPKVPAKVWQERAACALGGVGLGFLSAGFFWNAVGGLVLAGVTEEARQAGYAVEMPSPQPKIADENNAAFWYKRINAVPSLAKIEQREPDNKLILEFIGKALNGKAGPKDYANARELVARHGDGLKLAERAASSGGMNWEIDWNHDPIWEMPIPQYFGVVMMGRILAVRAILEARDGNSRQAVESVRLGLVMSRALGDQDHLIGTLCQMLISKSVLDAASIVLRAAPLSLVLKQWQPLLNPESVEKSFWAAMGYENFAQALWFSHIGWWDVVFGKYRQLREGSLACLSYYWPFLKLDISSSLRANIAINDSMKLPYPKIRENYRQAFENSLRTRWILAQVAAPEYTKIHGRMLIAMTTLRLARAALAAKQFKEQKNRWPDSSQEEDPFAAAPFKLLKRGGGLVIYSVGPDGADDRGEAFDAEKLNGDLSWRL